MQDLCWQSHYILCKTQLWFEFMQNSNYAMPTYILVFLLVELKQIHKLYREQSPHTSSHSAFYNNFFHSQKGKVAIGLNRDWWEWTESYICKRCLDISSASQSAKMFPQTTEFTYMFFRNTCIHVCIYIFNFCDARVLLIFCCYGEQDIFQHAIFPLLTCNIPLKFYIHISSCASTEYYQQFIYYY